MENQEDESGLNYDKDTPMVPFFKMFQYSSFKVKVYLAIGLFSSILAGFSMPLFIIFIGDLYNSFDPDTTAKKLYGNFPLILINMVLFFLFPDLGLIPIYRMLVSEVAINSHFIFQQKSFYVDHEGLN